jgi:hypothetical protein
MRPASRPCRRSQGGSDASASTIRYRSFLGDAGIPEERSDRYLGHSSGRASRIGRSYSHRIAGQLAADADTLEAYLQGEAGRSRSRCSGRGAGRLARGLARKAPGRIVEPNVTGLGD